MNSLNKAILSFIGILPSLSATLFLSTYIHASQRDGEEVRVGYVDRGDPFLIKNNGKLDTGLVVDIANKISKHAGMKPRYVEIPTKRVTSLLKNGDVNMVCFYHRNWSEAPDQLAWGPELLEYREVFVNKISRTPTAKDFDRNGKTIGTHMGYLYSKETMDLFSQNLASRVELTDTDKLYQMLELNRLDYLIDNEISFRWRQNRLIASKFELSGIVDNRYNVTCALTKVSTTKTAKLLKSMHTLKNEGVIDRIVDKYLMPINQVKLKTSSSLGLPW